MSLQNVLIDVQTLSYSDCVKLTEELTTFLKKSIEGAFPYKHIKDTEELLRVAGLTKYNNGNILENLMAHELGWKKISSKEKAGDYLDIETGHKIENKSCIIKRKDRTITIKNVRFWEELDYYTVQCIDENFRIEFYKIPGKVLKRYVLKDLTRATRMHSAASKDIITDRIVFNRLPDKLKVSVSVRLSSSFLRHYAEKKDFKFEKFQTFKKNNSIDSIRELEATKLKELILTRSAAIIAQKRS